MILRPGDALRVALAYRPGDEVALGRIVLTEGTAFFGYDDAYLISGARFHPVWGRPDRSAIPAKNPRAFKGLHGAFADSLPDAWGFELMRRRLATQGIDYAGLTALDRLALVGHTGVGALVYRRNFAAPDAGDVDLDALAAGAESILEGDDTAVVEELARLGGSSGGARPKVFVARNDAGHTIAGNSEIPDGYLHYLVKFHGNMDVADIGPLEAAYADMARDAGLIVSPTALIAASKGPGYFATQRFDRGPKNERIHVLSAAGILDVDWTQPAIDYVQLITLVQHVTKSQADAEQMFRRMVFNVFACNRDDHTKQHGFLQARDGQWRLAPAYDLTYTEGPNGEHYLAVNGKGKNIELDDVFAVANEVMIRPARAREIVDEVRGPIAGFERCAATYDVSASTTAIVKRAIARSSPPPARPATTPKRGTGSSRKRRSAQT